MTDPARMTNASQRTVALAKLILLWSRTLEEHKLSFESWLALQTA